VELHLMQILSIIREELATVSELPFDFTDELTVPGNTEGMRKEMEKELRRFQRAVEKLVPEKRRRELGFAENNDKSKGG